MVADGAARWQEAVSLPWKRICPRLTVAQGAVKPTCRASHVAVVASLLLQGPCDAFERFLIAWTIRSSECWIALTPLSSTSFVRPTTSGAPARAVRWRDLARAGARAAANYSEIRSSASGERKTALREHFGRHVQWVAPRATACSAAYLRHGDTSS